MTYIQDLEVNVDIVDYDISTDMYSASLGVPAVAMDIETSGLDLAVDRMATIQVYNPAYGIEVVRLQEGQGVPDNLAELLEITTVAKIFHYAPFDLGFIMRDWRIFPESIKDTRIAATMLDPRRERFWNPARQKYDLGLAALVYYYYGVELNKSIAVSNWFGDLSEEQVLYAARDVLYLPDLLAKLESELRPEYLRAARKAYQFIPTKVYLKLNNLPDPTERVE